MVGRYGLAASAMQVDPITDTEPLHGALAFAPAPAPPHLHMPARVRLVSTNVERGLIDFVLVD